MKIDFCANRNGEQDVNLKNALMSLGATTLLCCILLSAGCPGGSTPPDNGNGNNNGNDNNSSETGACCSDSGACSVTTREGCSGSYQGDDVTCAAAACDELSPFSEEAIARGVNYRVIFGRGDEAGSGVALIDLDNDGDADLVAMGRVGDGAVGIWENDGTGQFTDRTDGTGIPLVPDAHGVCAGDYDDDGDLDLYLTQWQVANILLRNDGDFRFTDVTTTAGVGGVGYGGGCAWADYDGDQLIDVYVGNWEYTDRNFLYRNLGDGTFEDVAPALGVDSDQRTYQPVWFDYDGDADLDLYLSNDNTLFFCGPDRHNELFRNDGGTFTDVSAESGADVCLNSMGAALGDFDRNLHADVHLTNLPPGNVMILNQGDGTFINGSADAGIDLPGDLGWGTVAFDYDHNGFEDLYVVFNDGVNRFYNNAGTFPLTNIAADLGLEYLGESYCVATGDIDLDGDLDLVMSARQIDLRIYINNEGQKRDWVKFQVVGEGRNRGGIGTQVRISAGGAQQIRHLLFGNNYKSQNETILHFGLDSANTVNEIVATWPGGTTRTLTNYAANRLWTLYPPQRLGDFNGDGTINSTDVAALTDCVGDVRPGCEMMDYDGDGDVDSSDASAQMR